MTKHAQLTRICLVRHGETPWNTERRLQGHLDVPLNPVGQAQARATGEALRKVAFDACYSSDLSRARHTAQAITTHHGKSLQISADLRERHYGIFQGLTHGEAERRHPDEYTRFIARDPAFSLPDGGESLLTLSARITGFLEALLDTHRGQTVLVVTHGGVLDIAHRLVNALPLEPPRSIGIPNAGINWLHHEHTWQIERWGDTRHLDARSLDELAHT